VSTGLFLLTKRRAPFFLRSFFAFGDLMKKRQKKEKSFCEIFFAKGRSLARTHTKQQNSKNSKNSKTSQNERR
jgi:hypothetical protein